MNDNCFSGTNLPVVHTKGLHVVMHHHHQDAENKTLTWNRTNLVRTIYNADSFAHSVGNQLTCESSFQVDPYNINQVTLIFDRQELAWLMSKMELNVEAPPNSPKEALPPQPPLPPAEQQPPPPPPQASPRFESTSSPAYSPVSPYEPKSPGYSPLTPIIIPSSPAASE